jgi:hypothetical protein
MKIPINNCVEFSVQSGLGFGGEAFFDWIRLGRAGGGVLLRCFGLLLF